MLPVTEGWVSGFLHDFISFFLLFSQKDTNLWHWSPYQGWVNREKMKMYYTFFSRPTSQSGSNCMTREKVHKELKNSTV